MPDHDDVAEQALLGAMMNDAAAVTAALVHVRQGDLYRPHNAVVWSAILDAADWGDPAAVHILLSQRGQLAALPQNGAYLIDCLRAGEAGNVTVYAKAVARCARAREAAVDAARLGQAADDPDKYQALLLEFAEKGRAQAGGDRELGNTPVDWSAFLAGPLPDIRHLAGRILAHGQQAALVGAGKVGKSLLAFEWAWRAAAGLPFLGDIARDPIRVLYVDKENPPEEIHARALALGAAPGELTNLTYLQFPLLGELDTERGAAAFLADVDRHQPELVFLDTVSRMIKGKENDSDTWLDLYKHAIIPLKAAGIASVRLDHFGKDEDRGSRGSSAKSQDVDAVWELSSTTGNLLTLNRTHTRSGLGESAFVIRRLGNKDTGHWAGTRHVLADHGDDAVSAAVLDIAGRLDQAGVERLASRDETREACATLRIKVRNTTLGAVVAYRKRHWNDDE